jgi:hypothetical protein
MMKGGATGGAALLGIGMGKQRALVGNAVDAGRVMTHHAQVVGADIAPAYIIAPATGDSAY